MIDGLTCRAPNAAQVIHVKPGILNRRLNQTDYGLFGMGLQQVVLQGRFVFKYCGTVYTRKVFGPMADKACPIFADFSTRFASEQIVSVATVVGFGMS